MTDKVGMGKSKSDVTHQEMDLETVRASGSITGQCLEVRMILGMKSN